MNLTAGLFCLAALVSGTVAYAQQVSDGAPLSAINWLSRSVEPSNVLPPAREVSPTETTANPPDVRVALLDRRSPNTVGLLPPSLTGLPRSLWRHTPEDVLVSLVLSEDEDTLPALHDMLLTLLLADADPPFAASPDAPLFLARVDKLLALGAIEQAQALLQAADPDTPELFRRMFDVALLNGTEAEACKVIEAKPSIAPTYPARVFCIARAGQWRTAALILNTGRALGDISEEEDALLSRFLDPELFEDEPPLQPPSRITPLTFRLREAVGERLATHGLPLAFAHADLQDSAGWRNQIEAVERLSRRQVVSENLLQAIYTAREPAASGGVWDRIALFQKFDNALSQGDATTVADILPSVWNAMADARLETVFASLYAEEIARLTLPEAPASTVLRISLLSTRYQNLARSFAAQNETDAFLQALALGAFSTVGTPTSPRERAVLEGFTTASPSAEQQERLQSGRIGEALLVALKAFEEGRHGDPQQIAPILAVFLEVGLVDFSRRVALQYLLLDRDT